MTTSIIDADSLLAIDIGSVTTRAVLFDVVDGRYRFLASSSAQTTAYAPYNNISEGVRMALDRLQNITGRVMIGENERLIVPSAPDGSGVDTVVATISAGPPLKVAILGLLESVSLESAKHLVSTTYAKVVETISLNDGRKVETRIDSILRLQPDLVLIAGGTDGGASQSVMNLLEVVGLASYLSLEDRRPEVLYTGNKVLKEEVRSSYSNLGTLHFAPNIRPTLDTEQLEPAQARLAGILRNIRRKQMPGVDELDVWSKNNLIPTATAFGRVVRFLNKVYGSSKGVLGIDIGASATTIAASFTGKLTQAVYPDLGMGWRPSVLADTMNLKEITRWLHLEIPDEYVRQYLFNKELFPFSIPVTVEDLAIEQALVRQILQVALERTLSRLPQSILRYGSGLLPDFEPVVATGSVLTHSPNIAQSFLTLLDSIQPTGVTTLVLDQNHLSFALGAAAAINPVLAVQVLESSTFLNLATVISPMGDARPGTPILRLRMVYENGNETSLEVKQGTLAVLQLPLGQSAQIQLQPLHRYDVGMGGPGRGGRLKVVGGALGVVVDARGRPIRLPPDPALRRELLVKWRRILGC